MTTSLVSITVVSMLALAGIGFVSCGSTKVAPAPVEEEPQQETPAPEPVVEQPKPVEPPKPQKTAAQLEYERSVGNTHVSLDTFEQDKAQILRIIKELDIVMKDYNYKAWLTYLDQQSINYWSQKKNLSTAQKKLPVKGLRLNSLEDYFKYIFVPARKGKEVTEIRYVSDKNSKAVQVQENMDIVYYNFNKINNVWKLHIPENE